MLLNNPFQESGTVLTRPELGLVRKLRVRVNLMDMSNACDVKLIDVASSRQTPIHLRDEFFGSVRMRSIWI